MTIRKLFKKYKKLSNKNYETIVISQIISDLREIIREEDLRRYKREGRI